MDNQKDRHKVNELDLAFHDRIFIASGNRLSQRIFPVIQRAMLSSIAITSTLVDVEHTLSFHRPIYDAIYRRKPLEAREKMIEHLQDAQRLLTETGTRPEPLALLDSFQPLDGHYGQAKDLAR